MKFTLRNIQSVETTLMVGFYFVFRLEASAEWKRLQLHVRNTQI